MDIKDLLKNRRIELGLSQDDVAKFVGVTKATISRWESGNIANMRRDRIMKLSSVLQISPATITHWEMPEAEVQEIGRPVGEMIGIPVVANVSAGYDNLAVESFTGEVMYIPAYLLRGYSEKECRILHVKGDSMYPQIVDGDNVLVHLQSSVDSGDLAVVIYNSDEATIKKVRYVPGEDWMELIPSNPEFKAKRIEGPDLELCRVYGRVMSLIREF